MKPHLTGSLLLMVLSLPAMAQIRDEEPQLAEFQPQASSEQKSNSGAVAALNPDFFHVFDIQDRGLGYEEFAWKHLADIQRSPPEAESPATRTLIRSRALRQRRSFEFAPPVFP